MKRNYNQSVMMCNMMMCSCSSMMMKETMASFHASYPAEVF